MTRDNLTDAELLVATIRKVTNSFVKLQESNHTFIAIVNKLNSIKLSDLCKSEFTGTLRGIYNKDGVSSGVVASFVLAVKFNFLSSGGEWGQIQNLFENLPGNIKSDTDIILTSYILSYVHLSIEENV